jgi:hypothetical protein
VAEESLEVVLTIFSEFEPIRVNKAQYLFTKQIIQVQLLSIYMLTVSLSFNKPMFSRVTIAILFLLIDVVANFKAHNCFKI